MDEDLEDCWADIRAGRPKYEPPPVPTLWVGLLNAEGQEPTSRGYQRVRFTPDTLDFTFPTFTEGMFTVTSLAWFETETGSPPLFAMTPSHTATLMAGDTLSMQAPTLTVDSGRTETIAELFEEVGKEGLLRLFQRGR